MKRIALVVAVFFLLQSAEGASSGAETYQGISWTQVQDLREIELSEPKDWDKYIELAKQVVEKTRAEKPSVMNEVTRLNEVLPGIIEDMRKDALATGATGITVASNQDFPALDSQVGDWISEKTSSIESELQRALADIKEVDEALLFLAELAGTRERKQSVIREVVLIIAEVLRDDERRENNVPAPEGEKGKTDRLDPSAGHTPQGDPSSLFATK